jgi:hypothetical protein
MNLKKKINFLFQIILIPTILISIILFFLCGDYEFALNTFKERVLSLFLFLTIMLLLKYLYEYIKIGLYEIFDRYLKDINFFTCLYNYLELKKSFQIKLLKTSKSLKEINSLNKKWSSLINFTFYLYSFIYLFSFYKRSTIIFLNEQKIICFIIFVLLIFIFKINYWFNIYKSYLRFLNELLKNRRIDTKGFVALKIIIVSQVSFFIFFEAFFLCFLVISSQIFFDFNLIIDRIIRFLFYMSLNKHFLGNFNKIIYLNFIFLIHLLVF